MSTPAFMATLSPLSQLSDAEIQKLTIAQARYALGEALDASRGDLVLPKRTRVADLRSYVRDHRAYVDATAVRAFQTAHRIKLAARNLDASSSAASVSTLASSSSSVSAPALAPVSAPASAPASALAMALASVLSPYVPTPPAANVAPVSIPIPTSIPLSIPKAAPRLDAVQTYSCMLPLSSGMLALVRRNRQVYDLHVEMQKAIQIAYEAVELQFRTVTV